MWIGTQTAWVWGSGKCSGPPPSRSMPRSTAFANPETPRPPFDWARSTAWDTLAYSGTPPIYRKLVQADPKGVPNASVYTFETTLHLPVEKVVEPASEPLNAEHQLSAPRAITGVE